MALTSQVLGTDELSTYLNKYRLELDPQLDALVGRYFKIHVLSPNPPPPKQKKKEN